jgi:glutaredoxin 3
MKKITIYSTPTCHFCNLAKDFFKEKGVKYEEFNVATDLAKRKEMVDKSGQMGVPVIDIGGSIVVGFDEEQVAGLLEA